MLYANEVGEVQSILNELKVPYYLNAGTALHLRKFFDDKNGDCDIRVYHPDIKALFEVFRERYPDSISLRPPLKYSGGTYDTFCIELELGTSFDIYTEMIADCDMGRFVFPFDEATFADVDLVEFENLILPVASLENLLLYYLVLRRGRKDKKDDGIGIRNILAAEGFDAEKFEKIMAKLPYGEKVREIYQGYKK